MAESKTNSTEPPLGKRVLIVENDRIIAEHLRRVLTKLGYEVAGIVVVGEKALQKVDETSPDLVLMDIYLGGALNGIETAAQIRARIDIPVIYLTAYSDDALLQQAKITGPFGYLVKPVPDRELYATIEMALYRHRLETQLKENQAMLQGIMDHSPAIIFIKDLAGRYMLVNRHYETEQNLTREEVIGKTDYDIFPKEIADTFCANDLKVLASGQPQEAEEIGLRKDGLHTCISLKFPLLDAGGEAYAICGIATDITERKQMEEALQKSVQEMKIAYEQASIYARELAEEIAEREQAQAEIQKLNEELEQRVADRTRKLSALYGVTAVASEALDLETMLDQLLERVLLAMKSNTGHIHLLDESGETLGLVAEQGLSPDVVAQIDPLPLAKGLAGWVMTHGEPLLVPDIAADSRTNGLIDFNDRAYVGVPIWAGGRALGVLSVFGTVGQQFNADEAALLASIADQVGVAVENARLRQRAEQAAVMEERARLARDLHDVVSQSLFSASVIAETLPRLWDRNPETVRQSLADLHRLTRGALAEMRTLLMELRPATLAEADLEDLLRQLTEAITGRTQMEVSLSVTGQHTLPSEAKTTIFHIAQEALNNIAKHARASQATISLNGQPDQVVLSISDDGRGFDPKRVPPGHLGIGIMRERVEAIGATLEIISQPGHGTEVVVTWPRTP